MTAARYCLKVESLYSLLEYSAMRLLTTLFMAASGLLTILSFSPYLINNLFQTLVYLKAVLFE